MLRCRIADLPTKFELLVNLKTANTLRVKIPDSILFRVDEVIRWATNALAADRQACRNA